MAQQSVLLVTGSNSGIGNAVAKKAVEAGFIVYGGARRQDTFPAVEAVGARPVRLDVADEDSMVQAVAQIEADHGAVDVLVNNAGYGQMGAIEEITREQWLRQYETNVFGLVRMAQLVIPAMRRQRHGRILNISSMGGQFTFPLAGAYHSTKYAVESINEAMRFELKPFGIRVVTIQPAPVSTPLAHNAASTLPDSSTSPYQRLHQSLVRLSQQSPGYVSPERVARVIVDAAMSPRPKTRYKVGAMAHMMPALHTLLSDSWWDRLVAGFYR